MPAALRQNDALGTMLGRRVVVLRRIGGGGQGEVYEVLYDGERKALKWYHPGAIRDVPRFARNLRDNILRGRPTREFLWPIDLTEFRDGTFGYVMDLRPEGYAELNDFLANRATFPSYRRAVDACLWIAYAFGVLHDAGYAYQDINSKNFFIAADTGRVLICDNDNVAPDGTDTGMVGTWGFVAPEVVRGGRPDAQSDLHSMAVLIFLLLLRAHPLEGARAAASVLDDAARARIYGTDPLFVFDGRDRSNALDPARQAGTIRIWEQLPAYLRELFCRAFSREALLDARRRPLEVEWLCALARFRSEIQPCRCGRSELVLAADSLATCEACGATTSARLVLDLGSQALPALYDTRLYRCQLQPSSPLRALDLVGIVVRAADDPSVLGLLNLSGEPWREDRPSGGHAEVPPRGCAVLEPGLGLGLGHARVSVRAGRGGGR